MKVVNNKYKLMNYRTTFIISQNIFGCRGFFGSETAPNPALISILREKNHITERKTHGKNSIYIRLSVETYQILFPEVKNPISLQKVGIIFNSVVFIAPFPSMSICVHQLEAHRARCIDRTVPSATPFCGVCLSR